MSDNKHIEAVAVMRGCSGCGSEPRRLLGCEMHCDSRSESDGEEAPVRSNLSMMLLMKPRKQHAPLHQDSREARQAIVQPRFSAIDSSQIQYRAVQC
jgi:hypothetical protein